MKNPYAVTNWVLAMLFGYFALWSGCSCILDNTGLDFATAATVMKVQNIGWSSFITYYFLFILYLTDNKRLLLNPLFIVPFLLLPFVFIFQNFTGNMLECCRNVPYGIAGTWKNAPWPHIFFGYYTAFFILSVYMLVSFRRSTGSRSEKKIADIMLWSIAAIFVIGTFFGVIMNYMGIYNPVDTNVVFLIFVGGLIYCAEKYEAFKLSSVRNADRIMDLINEGVVLLDGDGSFITANRAAIEIFGCPDVRLTEKEYGFIEQQLANAGVSSAGAEASNTELMFRDARGAERTILVSNRLTRNGNAASGRVCTIRDISGLKKAEVDLFESVKELKRSNEELENFAYVASHDLKEPLRMVMSYVQLIRKRFMDKLGQEGNDFINFASEGAQRMSELIEGLLRYSRLRKAQKDPEAVDTSAVAGIVIKAMKLSMDEKKAVVGIDGPLPVLKADRVQMEQLFQNLIGNAVKFSGKEPPRVTIRAERRGAFYEFVFRDNGIGIDMHYKERIFQLFQRLNARDEYEGTGMGLAICRKIVESYGGRIWVESEGPGKGCSFYFTMPAALRETGEK
jgi:PAS domain S-box-containing protein